MFKLVEEEKLCMNMSEDREESKGDDSLEGEEETDETDTLNVKSSELKQISY